MIVHVLCLLNVFVFPPEWVTTISLPVRHVSVFIVYMLQLVSAFSFLVSTVCIYLFIYSILKLIVIYV